MGTVAEGPKWSQNGQKWTKTKDPRFASQPGQITKKNLRNLASSVLIRNESKRSFLASVRCRESRRGKSRGWGRCWGKRPESGKLPVTFWNFCNLALLQESLERKKVWLQFRSSRNELKTPSMLISDEKKTKTCQKMFRWVFTKNKISEKNFQRIDFQKNFFQKSGLFKKKSLFLFFLPKKIQKVLTCCTKISFESQSLFLVRSTIFFYLLNNENPFYISLSLFLTLSS